MRGLKSESILENARGLLIPQRSWLPLEGLEFGLLLLLLAPSSRTPPSAMYSSLTEIICPQLPHSPTGRLRHFLHPEERTGYTLSTEPTDFVPEIYPNRRSEFWSQQTESSPQPCVCTQKECWTHLGLGGRRLWLLGRKFLVQKAVACAAKHNLA